MTKYRRRRESCLPSVSTVILSPQSGRRISDHFFHGRPAVVDFWFLFPISGQVEPTRVLFLDKRDLFRAKPAFESLFAGDRGIHITKVLEPYQAIELVALRESRQFAVFMLSDSALKIVGHADVESAAMFVSDDVDVVVVIAHG